jgi:ABC-2 type transport system permease protein
MSHVVIDLKAALRTFLRNKSTIFWTIAFPTVLMLLFGAIFSQSSTKYDLYLQNQDQTNGESTYWSGALITALNSTNAFNLQQLDASINATDYAIANRLASLLIIPSGFNDTANVAIFTHGTTKANVTFVFD